MTLAAEISGRGVVSSIGQDVASFAQAVLAGQTSVGSIDDILSDMRFHQGAPVRGFDPAAHFDSRAIATIDRFTQFATVAARQAWAESGLAAAKPEAQRIAVVVGTANGGIDIIEDGYRRLLLENLKPRPFTIPMNMANAAACRIALEIGARGPVFAVSSACASAAHAMLVGHTLIAAGLADVAVVGGTDSCFPVGFLRAWDALRVVSGDLCRPFSRGRAGLILGEGSAIFVIERPGASAARGRKPLAHFMGGGMSSDAGDLLAPDWNGMAGAMRLALQAAGWQPDQVDYVNAHGTGTPANDKAESRAILEVFGPRQPPLPVSSTKSMIGHALGASGALEALATLAALEQAIIPPTINFLEADPDCPVDAVPNHPRPAAIARALSNSFAFGGLNVSLAFARA
jgi:nodulation protein E